MHLSIQHLSRITVSDSGLPAKEIFTLPEKILQFGTGVLLRALPDFFVDKANRMGLFNGRILVVKSTNTGGMDDFNNQDGLYTLITRGMENGVAVNHSHINSAISRVLSADGEWEEILKAASAIQMQVVISNTTEVGIQLIRESIFQKPPLSFPAKLLACLYERYKNLGDGPETGLTIIPTELLTNNGKLLKSILIELAEFNQLEEQFMGWLINYNQVCNSLVDRIVPGKPDAESLGILEKEWGYQDKLAVVCEPYRLWAIEGNQTTAEILSFADADAGLIITDDITKYKELKLRMLNATHTLSCSVGYLGDYETVRLGMEDRIFEPFIRNLMMHEIAGAIPYEMAAADIQAFGMQVLDRFRNPYLQHPWLSITVQYSSKMAMRVVPVLKRYYELNGKSPRLISAGFAAFILFMRPVKKDRDRYYGVHNQEPYLIQDDRAAYFYSLWQKVPVDDIVDTVLANTEIWQTDLGQLKGLSNQVSGFLKKMMNQGITEVLASLKYEPS